MANTINYKLLNARRRRILALRREEKSLRAIAQIEDVAVYTVERDLRAVSGAKAVTDRVRGIDGRSYPSSIPHTPPDRPRQRFHLEPEATAGELLRGLRLASGVGTLDLCKQAGVSPKSLRDWERDWRLPASGQAVKLAKVLRVLSDAILGPLAKG